jgi:hypothetical protein
LEAGKGQVSFLGGSDFAKNCNIDVSANEQLMGGFLITSYQKEQGNETVIALGEKLNSYFSDTANDVPLEGVTMGSLGCYFSL